MMIKSIWKPNYQKSKIVNYELISCEPSFLNDLKGKTAYKVIWLCDSEKCKNPNKVHSINACHLTKDKLNINLQICRPCQCSGEGNGRYGDHRSWDEILGVERSIELKTEYKNKWIGDKNPSHNRYVKEKKGQQVIDEKTLPKLLEKIDYKLLKIKKLSGKNSELVVECPKGHVIEKKYQNIFNKNRKYICSKCFYNDISLNLSEKELARIDNYKKQVRALSAKNYRKYKSLINPKNLELGRGKHHLDHIYSIHEGFKNNVDIKIISSKENLQIITETENTSKQSRCDISLDELIQKTEYLYK